MSALADLDPWTLARADVGAQAQIWQARHYARWLLSAGAEPRLGLLLCSGDVAVSRWAQLVAEQGVDVVRCVVTPSRPLPEPLTRHRGDHFNRRLFALDGLDDLMEESDEVVTATLKTLDGQRGQLKQAATWVTLVARRPRTLARLLELAPRACALVQRRCLIWEASEVAAPAAPPPPLPAWAHLVDGLFWEAAQPARAPRAERFGQLVRCGAHLPAPGACEGWRRLYDLWRGDGDFGVRQRSSGAGVVSALPSDLSADVAFAALLHRPLALSAGVRAQLEALLSPLDAWRLERPDGPLAPSPARAAALAAHDPDLAPWARLRAALRAASAGGPEAADLTPALLDACEGQLTRLAPPPPPEPLWSQAALWLAEGRAVAGDAEGCARALRALSDSPRASREARAVADERLVALCALLNERGAAQEALERLEAAPAELLSPLYEVRALLRKASFLGALDPSRGARERAEAARLGLVHGVAVAVEVAGEGEAFERPS